MKLTKEDQAILQVMARELSSKEIAEVLGLKLRTVEDKKLNLYKKINVRTAIGDVLYGISNGIVRIKILDKTKTAR